MKSNTVTRILYVGLVVGPMARPLTLLAAETSSTKPANLAPNPGFEIADANAPAFWAQRTPTDDKRTLTWDDQVHRSGRRSLKTANHAAVQGRWRTGHLRDLALAVGTQCQFSAWVKTADVQGAAFLRLYFLRGDGSIVAQPRSAEIDGTAPWRQLRVTAIVPKGTAYGMLYLELHGTGTAWFDDVVLTGHPSGSLPDDRPPPRTYAPREFEPVRGYVRDRIAHKGVWALAPDTPDGRARAVFWGETARYDLTVTYADAPRGTAAFELLVNDRCVAQWKADAATASSNSKETLREHLIRGVDIQQRSTITIKGRADDADRAAFHKVMFTAAGRYRGDLLPADELRLPPTLRVHVTPDERRHARGTMGRLVGRIREAAQDARDRELAELKTPAQWRTRQQRTRERLPDIVGDFEPKCPLKPRIVGKLDRPDYVIEKLIVESQPGYHVTANVYVPKRRPLPRPAVLFTCGHAKDGKAYHLYHDACLGFVLKGYVVLALDPTGQGERAEYFDPETGKPTVPLCVAHHHYLGRPSWLVGRTLAGYRTWDCIRALDYLTRRDEVDPQRIAAVGNSGGGIMALLITAVDERIKVCAAAHPGGSMEQTFLTGRRLAQCEILSLIAPRPCLIIVGRESGEEAGHRAKLVDMHRFYAGLGVSKDRAKLVLVDGVHNMKKAKREPAYGWVNRWLGQTGEGSKEPPLQTESVEDLRCSETGLVIRDLEGESGWTLNAKLAARLRPPRDVPADAASRAKQRAELRRAIARRIGLDVSPDRTTPHGKPRGRYDGEGFRAEKLLIAGEPGLELPALLLTPKSPNAEAPDRSPKPVVLHVAETGKPTTDRAPSVALGLVRQGLTVLSVDVRAAGELDPRDRSDLKPLAAGYDAMQFRVDAWSVDGALAGTTMLAGQAGDIMRSVDDLTARHDLAGRPIVLVGEGLGGVWALTAAAFDERISGVVCIATVPSYKLIVASQYYKTRDYFWVPGALCDFDLPDLIGLIAPRPVTLIDPVDALLDPLPMEKARELLTWPQRVFTKLGRPTSPRIVHTENRSTKDAVQAVVRVICR